jgi:putative flippase GtrA
MFLKVFKYFWSVKRQFAKYFVVGVSGLVIDFTIMVMIKEVFDVRSAWAAAVSQIFSIAFIFTANKYWSFQNQHQTRAQMFRYSLVLAFDSIYAVAAMHFFSDVLGFDYRLVRLASIALMVVWNFFLYKYFVYRKPKEAAVAKE